MPGIANTCTCSEAAQHHARRYTTPAAHFITPPNFMTQLSSCGPHWQGCRAALAGCVFVTRWPGPILDCTAGTTTVAVIGCKVSILSYPGTFERQHHHRWLVPVANFHVRSTSHCNKATGYPHFSCIKSPSSTLHNLPIRGNHANDRYQQHKMLWWVRSAAHACATTGLQLEASTKPCCTPSQQRPATQSTQ